MNACITAEMLKAQDDYCCSLSSESKNMHTFTQSLIPSFAANTCLFTGFHLLLKFGMLRLLLFCFK